jgi:hypothetical protein
MSSVSRLGKQIEEGVATEGLIAFKLQGFVNNPRRTQDLEDIRALIRANRDTINFTEVREYFAVFGRETLLDEIWNRARPHLTPLWIKLAKDYARITAHRPSATRSTPRPSNT